MGLELSQSRGGQIPKMDESLSHQIDALRALTLQQLTHKHLELFGEAPGSRHKQQLARRIAWRLQVVAEGGLSERARRRALEIVQDADLRLLPPSHPRAKSDARIQLSAKDRRVPQSGAVLTREFKGKHITVTVLEHGFEHNGQVFKSLSAVAQQATGTSWNGYAFFRLRS
jgi:hypothetical protein